MKLDNLIPGVPQAKLIAGLVIAGLAILLIGALLLISHCSKPNKAVTAQAQQTSKSGDAFANASANAVATIANQTVTDTVIDQAVDNVQQEIGNAQDPDTIRGAVISGVCSNPAHRLDPACRVQ